MDLNASSLPEEEIAHEEHIETAVETMHREREQIRQRLKRDFPDEGPKQPRKQPVINTRFYDKNKLPPGWLDCPAAGDCIGYIIPSKVPLGETFNECIYPEVGLVIDLTNTTRYYQPSDWKKQGIKHVKIACKGRDSVPDPESVNSFVYEVLKFYSRRQNQSNKYILVHCTHGHNRTGFMIVHFLMRSQPLSVTDAIKAFHNVRPPGIYKQDYIDALYAFYHERKPSSVSCPNTPELCCENQVPTQVLMNNDVLGDAIPWDQQEEMRQLCYRSLMLGAGKTYNSDGTRYMMLITYDGCFLIDRNFNFRRVQMRFPAKQMEGRETHNLTLLDGEMIIDTLPDTQKVRRYLIYDLMVINSLSIMERPFCERWEMLEKEVIEPRTLERQYINRRRNPNYCYDLEPFGGWDDPYVPRAHQGLLKWKYPEMNSVDFLFEVVDENRQLLCLYERGKKKLMDGYHVNFKNGEDPSELSGKIIECSWDSEEQVWNCMRVRVDKNTPNDINTYRKVMQSIKDNITEDVLLEDIGEIVRLPMYADRIRNDTKAHRKQHSSLSLCQ
ncbi:hypothetical protein MKW92_038666 [Papaver armeniacum]|nr:hypothetical protein MKW92_038666 [Papaver armeniacum]